MILCMICKTRPAGIHINTGEDLSKHLWVCEECHPFQTKQKPVLYPAQAWIRNLRLDHGYSLRKLWQSTGVGVVELCNYENGRELLPREDEIRILQFFAGDHKIDKWRKA